MKQKKQQKATAHKKIPRTVIVLSAGNLLLTSPNPILKVSSPQASLSLYTICNAVRTRGVETAPQFLPMLKY
jgi:hypothetical protein